MKPQRCESGDNGDKCSALAVTFRMGKHVCTRHTPKGSDTCTHSLAPSGTCSYCGRGGVTATGGVVE